MNNLDTLQAPQQAAEQRRSADVGRSKATGLQCLVASSNAAARDWLVEAGRRWGWDVVACGTPLDALRSLVVASPQLALVDLRRPEGEAFRAMAEVIAGECKSLLVVCGNADDSAEEIWSRQLGAWYYLPGMLPSASLHLMFRDARGIVEARLGLPAASAAGNGAASNGQTGMARAPRERQDLGLSEANRTLGGTDWDRGLLSPA